MAWTDEMVEELKRLWAEGVTTGEIGRRLNISKNSIVGKVHRLGLSGRPSPIKKKENDAAPSKPAAKAPAKEKPTPKAEPKPTAPKPTPKAEAKVEKKPAPKAEPKPEVKAPIEAKVEPIGEEEDIKLAKSLNIEAPKPQKEFLSLTDLDNHTCRWPLGDPKDENFHFCGKKVRIGQTYCEEHAAIAYVKPNKK